MEKGNSLLGDVHTLPLRMAALAVQFVQSHMAFKNTGSFFLSPQECFQLAIIVTFLIIYFYCLFFFTHLFIMEQRLGRIDRFVALSSTAGTPLQHVLYK